MGVPRNKKVALIFGGERASGSCRRWCGGRRFHTCLLDAWSSVDYTCFSHSCLLLNAMFHQVEDLCTQMDGGSPLAVLLVRYQRVQRHSNGSNLRTDEN